jgi:hypothetical protein
MTNSIPEATPVIADHSPLLGARPGGRVPAEVGVVLDEDVVDEPGCEVTRKAPTASMPTRTTTRPAIAMTIGVFERLRAG